MAHAQLSPSKAYRWIACPGSIAKCLALGIEEAPQSGAAADGTFTHYLLNRNLTEEHFTLNVGDKYDLGGEKEWVLDADRIERVHFVSDYVADRIKDQGLCTLFAERQLSSARVFGRDDMGGTADVTIHGPNMLEVIDLKDGMHPVKAENNWQLIIYALLAYGELPPKTAYPETIRMTIVQPKLRVFGQSGIDSWEIPTKELMAFLPILTASARQTEDPNATLCPGDEQCRYCPAKGSCMALIEHSLAAGGINFGAVDLPNEVVNINATELSNERLRSLIMAIPLIQTMIEAAEEEALNRFTHGQPIDGLKVIRGRGSRGWNCEDDVVADRLRRMGVPKDVVYKTSVVTPTQAEKLKWKKKTGEEKKLTPRQVKALDEIIDRKEGKLKVVSEHADGKPVDLTPIAFAPVIPEWMR